MDIISKKLIDHFGGKVVRKDLTATLKRGANTPTYVLEYLLGMYCASEDETIINSGMQKVSRILSENYVRPGETEKVKYLIRENKEYTIIDKLSASFSEDHNCYVGSFHNLHLASFLVPEEYITNYTRILMGGIWCMVKIRYTPNEESDGERGKKAKKNSPHDSQYTIVSLKPIQIPNVNVSDIIDLRKQFTTEEWINLLLRSVGIESSKHNSKEKFHLIQRMVPLIERNYNLCELGPRGTGKSHIYKEISPYSILLSGGKTTSSSLFYNLNSNKMGLVGHWDSVAFDEVAGMQFVNHDSIQILKDFMASGSFSRGRETSYTDASLVFIGNINDSVTNILKTTHLFSPFPSEINNDSAFFDRFHYYIPGWEVPKMRAQFITLEYGFITDWFAEYCREMRQVDHTQVINNLFKLNHNVTTRDEIAIRRTVSGLVKLIHPHLEFEKEELEVILHYAIEGRRRVKEQLRRMAVDEFSDVDLGYITLDGREVIINLPEQVEETLINEKALHPGHVFAVGRNISNDNAIIYKIENKTIQGSGKMEIQGVIGPNTKAVKESLNAAWVFFQDNWKKVIPSSRISGKDILMYYGNPQKQPISAEISVAELVGICSAMSMIPVKSSTVILGNLTISGTVSHIQGLSDYLVSAYAAGAQYILLPRKCKANFEKVKDKELQKLSPLYYDNPIEAVKIALGFM